MLPIGYALRNLWRRRARTVATLLGVAGVTLLVILTSGFARGLVKTTAESAEDDVVIVTGSSGEHDLVRSVVSMRAARGVAIELPGVLEVAGERAVSIELHIATRVGSRVGLLRGVESGAFLVRPRVAVVDGREPRGKWELLVGRLAESRMSLPDGALDVGRTIELEGRPWTVVGRFAAPGTVLEAEMWGRLTDVMVATLREDVSCVAGRLESPGALSGVRTYVVRHGVDYDIAAVPETELYATLHRALEPIGLLAWVMAGLVLLGGVFACTNTMFAAVLARTREMGALRSIGYGPLAILVSLLQEALLLALLGGLIAFFAADLLGEVPLRFPMGAFYLDLSPPVRLAGLAAALTIGLLGGLVPAVRAVRIPIPDALGDKA
jgi:ABC-type lipoprotein release transport system permease subunit